MTLKKRIGLIHLWLGMASGLVVVILGITGCLYAFIDEIKPLVYHNRMYVEIPPGTRPLPLHLLKEKAQLALPDSIRIQNAEVATDPRRTVVFRARKFNKEALLYSEYVVYSWRIYVNPYTGQVVKLENNKWEFFTVVVMVHISLLLGSKVGGQIVAWSVVMFVLLLISGLVLWWPKNKNAARQRFSFKWKSTTQWKRKNYDLHNIPGFYILLFALVISLTGLIWSFEWFDKQVQWVANGGQTVQKQKPLLSDTTHRAAFSLDNILQKAQVQAPAATIFYLSVPQDIKNIVSVFARTEEDPNFKSIRLQYDQHTAALLMKKTFSDLNGGEKIRSLNYDLHVGSVLGLPGKILAFCVSFIAASLPITGFYIWWGRKKRAKKEKNKAVGKIAAVTR